jgi:hypothetical protein
MPACQFRRYRNSVTARSNVVLAALALAGFVAMILVRALSTSPTVATAAFSPTVRPARSASPPAPEQPQVTPSKLAALRNAPDAATVPGVGHADGAIHFEKRPVERDTKGDAIHIDVRSALGVWEPEGLVMRVLLLESPPSEEEIAPMLAAIRSGETGSISKRRAVLELRFAPTAQAFDRNELESATLIVSNGSLTSSADALSSLQWTGSLPSPAAPPPAGASTASFTLDTANETVSSTRDVWKQSWHLSLSVPVIMQRSAF